jgi:DNA repair exonuclease SbcCD nuclease subunit
MRIQIVSDLHLEFSDCFIKNENNADVLILGGDIMVANKVNKPESEYGIQFRDFLKRCSFQFPHVIYVAGNHEFYSSGKFFAGLEELQQACGVYENVYFLERSTKIIDDVVFVGGTLWTDLNKYDPLTMHAVRDMMNDYRATINDQDGFRKLKPADTAARHKQTIEYIKHIVGENKDKKCVVVGHHSPSFQSMHPMYASDHLMNGAYHSDLSEIMLDNPNIKLWTHGHTHHCFDYVIGETRVVCNPRGYDGHEDTGWDPNKIVEV